LKEGIKMMKKIISLSQFDIEAFIEQGAKVETQYIEEKGLPLDFKRGYDGVAIYKVMIDNKYECCYSIRYKREYGKGKIYLDKQF
jgi:hypothetical protein